MPKPIYLDHTSATSTSSEVMQAMLPFFSEKYCAVSSPHAEALDVFEATQKAYRFIKNGLGASDNDRFVLTSSGAESASQLLYSVQRTIAKQLGKNHFVISSLSDASIILGTAKLEEDACVTRLVKPSQGGYITASELAGSITPRTSLISLPWACALTGVVQPLEELIEISKLCKTRGILLHLDASHVLGKLYLDIADLDVDYVTFDAEYFHGPKGCGGILARGAAPLVPLISGGREDIALRGGLTNVSSLIGLGASFNQLHNMQDTYCTEVARLRDKLEKHILSGECRAVVLFKDQDRLPHCTCIAFPGAHQEALLYLLNRKGVYAGMGGGQLQKLDICLQSCGVTPDLAQSALTFSLSKDISDEEIDISGQRIIEVAKRLQKMSEHLVNKVSGR